MSLSPELSRLYLCPRESLNLFLHINDGHMFSKCWLIRLTYTLPLHLFLLFSPLPFICRRDLDFVLSEHSQRERTEVEGISLIHLLFLFQRCLTHFFNCLDAFVVMKVFISPAPFPITSPLQSSSEFRMSNL